MIDKQKIQELTYEFLKAIGENPEREGLLDTPKRVANMCEEIFGSVNFKNSDMKLKKFTESCCNSGTVEIKNIPVFSVCEHHLLPFFGDATIKYIPRNDTILGISKFSRVVDNFSRKPQLQERLTAEILDYLWKELSPKGLKVTLECKHMCMIMRGVKSINSATVTSAVKGEIE